MPNRDREQVALELDLRMRADGGARQADDPAERVADGVADRHPDRPALDQDAVEEVARLSREPGFVYLGAGHGRQRGRDPVGRCREVPGENRHCVRACRGRIAAPDERVRRRERRRVGGVLEEPPLHVEAPDVDREPGRGEQRRQGQREDDEHLAALADPPSAVPGGAGHQLITIVTSLPSPRRPFASLGRRAEISGITRSWWYVARTVICHPARASVSVTPPGSV